MNPSTSIILEHVINNFEGKRTIQNKYAPCYSCGMNHTVYDIWTILNIINNVYGIYDASMLIS